MGESLIDTVVRGSSRRGPVDDLLDAVARDPHRYVLRTINESITVGQMAAQARAAALRLQAAGVTSGDRVALVAGNSIERAVWLFGIWWLGATEVSINTELRGPLLRHVLDDSDPHLIVAQSEYLSAVAEVSDRPVFSVTSAALEPVPSETAAALDEEARRHSPADLATILYTSGTTGPAKGVMLPRAYFSNIARIWARGLDLTENDVGYFPMQFFHVDGHVLLSACLQTGSHLVFRPRFSVRAFWDDVTGFEVTWVAGVGSMLSMMATTEPPAAPHRVTRVIGAPIPQAAYEYFEDHLGIPVLTLYGQTECDGITMDTTAGRQRGSAGGVHPWIDVRVVDELDEPVPTGEVGEIVFRPRVPHLSALGYWRRPEHTVAAWRNLWFHTGDNGRLDEAGHLHFIGRRTDSFRRRGENISAWELEHTLGEHPNVSECIAIAVEDDHGGEDEIKLFVVPLAGFELDAFIEHCRTSLPAYACPRWVEITDGSDFVRSPGTGVVQKHFLSTDTSHAHDLRPHTPRTESRTP